MSLLAGADKFIRAMHLVFSEKMLAYNLSLKRQLSMYIVIGCGFLNLYVVVLY